MVVAQRGWRGPPLRSSSTSAKALSSIWPTYICCSSRPEPISAPVSRATCSTPQQKQGHAHSLRLRLCVYINSFLVPPPNNSQSQLRPSYSICTLQPLFVFSAIHTNIHTSIPGPLSLSLSAFSWRPPSQPRERHCIHLETTCKSLYDT